MLFRTEYNRQYYKRPSSNFSVPGLGCFRANLYAERVRDQVLARLCEDTEALEDSAAEKIALLPVELFLKLVQNNLMALSSLFFAHVDDVTLFYFDLFLHYFFGHDDRVEEHAHYDSEGTAVIAVEGKDPPAIQAVIKMNQHHLNLLTQSGLLAPVERGDYLAAICDFLGKNFFNTRLQHPEYQRFFTSLEEHYYHGCVQLKKIL